VKSRGRPRVNRCVLACCRGKESEVGSGCRDTQARLTFVSLDRPLIPDGGLVRVEPGGSASAALMEEVPALVEGDLQALQAGTLSLADLPAGLLLEELVLLVGQLVDAVDDPLVLHTASPVFLEL
jgi:hypothetical protein